MNNEGLSYFEGLKKIQTLLEEKYGADARYEAENLLADFLDVSKPELYIIKNKFLSPQVIQTLESLAQRRNAGEPLAYILGWSEFLGLRLEVSSAVLIPRLDSESMVLEGVEHLKNLKIKRPKILDLGAGSGALGMAVLQIIPEAELTSIDKSPAALQVLRRNAHRLGFDSRLKILEMDLDKESSFIRLVESKERFDLILANPPYIDPQDPELDPQVESYEPGLALYASALGLEKIFSWSQRAVDLLSSKGIYLCEMGWKQGDKVSRWAEQELPPKFKFSLKKDLSGKDRFFSLGIQNG